MPLWKYITDTRCLIFQLLEELKRQQEETGNLREYANILVSRLRKRRPGSLHAVADWLDGIKD